MKITKKNSPNHFNGRCGWKADMIVFHQTGNTSLSKSLSWYLNKAAECSPNYLIDINGDVYQLVAPENAAWCNGTATDPKDPKYYGYSLSDIVKSRKTNCNYYSYSAEFVHCSRGDITEAQKAAAVELIKTVIVPHMRANGVTPKIDRKHIIGHSEVSPLTRDPERYNCPGKLFPYDEIISRVLGEEVDPDSAYEPVQYIYRAVSTAAVRAGMSKSAKIYSRVTKGDYYPVDRIYTINGEKWLRHAGTEEYSMLVDGGALFQRAAAYSTKRTTCKINIRTSPGLKGGINDTLPAKTIVYMWGGEPPVLIDGYHWVKLVYEGKVVYAASEYLK
jgi:N-acetyl-anhydromuramyl-L-alanine amidase AmpD